MMVEANEADLRMQGEIMSGAAQKVADTAEEALEIAKDICDIGEALEAYLKGEYDDFIEKLGKGLEEICKEIGMVLEHPIEALKGEIEEKKEAIANATPKDFGYFAMGIVLDFLGPAAVKKAGKVIKTIAKHVRKPGGINAEKPSNGSITEYFINQTIAEALNGDGQQEEKESKPKVGKEDLDKARKEWEVPEKDTIAVGRTNVKGLENDIYIGGSPEVRKQAGLPTLDEAMPNREIKSPFTNPAFTRHAEEGVLNEFDQAVKRLGIAPNDVKGDLVIHQSNPSGVCYLCTSGIKNPEKLSGIFKQASEKYPNLTITVTSEIDPNVKPNGTLEFVLKNGEYID